MFIQKKLLQLMIIQLVVNLVFQKYYLMDIILLKIQSKL